MDWGSTYGPTAARSHGRPGRETRPASTTVDAHAHVFVAEAAAIAAPHLAGAPANPLMRFATEETRALNRRQDTDRRTVSTTHGLRVAELDAMGVDVQLCAPPPPQCYTQLPPGPAAEAIRAVNDGIAAFCAARPDRFAGLGAVPLHAPDAGVAELERALGLGLKGVQVLTNVEGRELSDPAFAPFWAAAERLGAPVMIHPNGFTEGQRLARHYFNNVVGNPFDTALALHHLIFDGVLERHPGLKILAVHGGGFLPAYSGRMDHAWGARPDARGGLPKPPTHYLRQIWLDTIVFTPHQLDYLIRVFGPERIVMGTDFPFDMAESDPIGHLRSVEGLDEATVEAIAGGNARRLFGL